MSAKQPKLGLVGHFLAEVPRAGISMGILACKDEMARIGFEATACVSMDASGAAMVEKCGAEGARLYDSSPEPDKLVYRQSHTLFVDARGRFYMFTLRPIGWEESREPEPSPEPPRGPRPLREEGRTSPRTGPGRRRGR